MELEQRWTLAALVAWENAARSMRGQLPGRAPWQRGGILWWRACTRWTRRTMRALGALVRGMEGRCAPWMANLLDSEAQAAWDSGETGAALI